MPFLYFPDAITLLLMLAALSLLRSLAVIHVRQELTALKNELLAYWARTGRPFEHPAHAGLRRRINSRIAYCGSLSPALVYWTQRFDRVAVANRYRNLASECSGVVEKELDEIAEKSIKSRISRFNLEGDVSFGTFYLLGSISGWMLMTPLFLRMLIRVGRHKSSNRVDYFFDVAEKVLARTGRRAHLRAQSVAIAA